MSEQKPVPIIKAGHYYAAKYRGENGDLIVGFVTSFRRDGHTVLRNMLTGKTAVKQSATLMQRNKRVSKPNALKIKQVFLDTGSKAKTRAVAVDTPAFGEKVVKAAPKKKVEDKDTAKIKARIKDISKQLAALVEEWK